MQNVLCSSLLSRKYRVKTYVIMIVTVPVVLYGCDTWSVTFREERRLRVFEKRMLRRLFGPKREETKGDWRTDGS
jgi:hypothetical protein